MFDGTSHTIMQNVLQSNFLSVGCSVAETISMRIFVLVDGADGADEEEGGALV